MARETTVTFNINLKSSSQGRLSRSNLPSGDIREIEKKTFDAINYCVQDIAFRAAKGQQRNIQNQLEGRVSAVVMQELRNMGRKINKLALGLGPGARWPQGGQLTIEGDISNTLRRTDPSRTQPMAIKAVTGQWRARTDEYLRRKAKKFGHRKWWLNTGALRDQLINPQMWIGAYGPVRVAWIPARIERSFKEGGIIRASNLARGQGRSYTLTVGEVKIRILGRLTPQMLNQPGEPSYDSRFNGLLEALPESVERKLAGRGDPYRVVIEPFLTFYINRQIPNRVWRVLESSMRPVGVTKG